MPIDSRKWLIESQTDEDTDLFRILESTGNQATLKYIAVDEEAAKHLICALDWLDTFRTGTIPGLTAPKPKRAPRKKPLVVKIEKPKARRRKT